MGVKIINKKEKNIELKIYELLEEVTKGDKCFRVNVDSYGLTRVDNGNGVGAMSGLGNAGSGGGAGGFGGAGARSVSMGAS